jgi:cyclophilin family peptidyl-prolyl cis-trans isomerase
VHGSQFRILFEADPRLDGKETVFGTVVNDEGRQILAGLDSLAPCTVIQSVGCDASPDMASALIIEEIVIEAS